MSEKSPLTESLAINYGTDAVPVWVRIPPGPLGRVYMLPASDSDTEPVIDDIIPLQGIQSKKTWSSERFETGKWLHEQKKQHELSWEGLYHHVLRYRPELIPEHNGQPLPPAEKKTVVERLRGMARDYLKRR